MPKIDAVTILGITAACLTTFSLVPQAARMHRTKKADQLSVTWIAMMLSGCIMWLIYGILRSDIAVTFANVVAFVLLTYILIARLRFS